MMVAFGDARLPPRFWDKVAPCPMSGCWLWTAQLDEDGYGRFSVGGHSRLAYGVVYVTVNNVVSGDLRLDHLCRVRSCVNPAHLEPVTNRENLLRGETLAAWNLLKQTCPRGHAYDRVRANGHRVCGRCADEQTARWRKKKRQAAAQGTR